MARFDEKHVDAFVHEVAELLAIDLLQKLSASSLDVIRRHTATCPECKAKYNEFLDAYTLSLTPEKRARTEAAARSLATEINEKTEQELYRAWATAEAITQGRPELVAEAQEVIRKRQLLFADLKEAFKYGHKQEMDRIVQQLQKAPLSRSPGA